MMGMFIASLHFEQEGHIQPGGTDFSSGVEQLRKSSGCMLMPGLPRSGSSLVVENTTDEIQFCSVNTEEESETNEESAPVQ